MSRERKDIVNELREVEFRLHVLGGELKGVNSELNNLWNELYNRTRPTSEIWLELFEVKRARRDKETAVYGFLHRRISILEELDELKLETN